MTIPKMTIKDLESFTKSTTKAKPTLVVFPHCCQRYTYRVLQTIQMKLILLCVWAEPAILGSIKTALKFKYEI